MSCYALIWGTAFKVDAPVDGNVRNYEGNGAHWLGLDTTDIHYTCRAACRDRWMAASLTAHDIGVLRRFGSAVISGSVRVIDGLPYADTVDLTCVYDGWPDYDVHCAHCGDLIHEGTDQ